MDLATGRMDVEELSDKMVLAYLGGTGFCARILYDELGRGLDPLGPENKLIIMTGPLTGTLVPQASRYVIAAKSPLTDGYGESHAGGHFGPELKFAGYDGVIFEGVSSEPVYLLIQDDDVHLVSASDLWGKTTYETEDLLHVKHGRDFRILSIGPAGENLSRIAGIVNDKSRIAARSGLGAVMGSKKLKAILVRGTKGITVADQTRYLAVMYRLNQKMRADPFLPSRIKYGTSILIEKMNEIGRLPTRNLQSGVFHAAKEIGGERMNAEYLRKPRACFACIQRCGRFVEVKDGPYAFSGEGPEFESLSSFGSRCGNADLESVMYANHLANQYGLDAIGAGAAIAWAMECYERGLLPQELIGELDLSWGNGAMVVKLVKMIAYREGLGDLLAEGTYRAAEIVDTHNPPGTPSTKPYVMHVKKQDIAGQEPRAQKSMGLAMVTAPRGADHLYGFPVLDEIGFMEKIKEWYGETYLPEIADLLSPIHKAYMIYVNEHFSVLVEAVGVCKYGTMVPPCLDYRDIAEALRSTCGLDFTREELERIGERIINLHRLFNIREGFTRGDDVLPDRLTKEPALEGPNKGEIVELNVMLDDYYRLRGWTKDGFPKRETLERLGLVCDEGDFRNEEGYI